MKLTAEDWAIRIQQYRKEAVSAFHVKQTSFYQKLLSLSKYITLDAFHAAKIIVLGDTQFQKMTTRSQKGALIDYSNDDWYTDIYYYYINKQSLLVDCIYDIVTKKQAQYY